MLNNELFAEKLQLLITHFGLNASSFADRINVQRSGISHILSGRNKPSLDFVLKIISEFKEVDLYWLLTDKGHFPSSDSDTLPALSNPVDRIANEKSIIPKRTAPPETQEKKENQIVRVIIFYKNGKFDSFEH